MNAKNLADTTLAILDTIDMYGAISTERLMSLWGNAVAPLTDDGLGRTAVRRIVEGLAAVGLIRMTAAELWIVA